MTDIQTLWAPAQEHIEEGVSTAGVATLETVLNLLNGAPSTAVGR